MRPRSLALILIAPLVVSGAALAATRAPAPPPPPTGPKADLGAEVDLGSWKDGYPPQLLTSLRAAAPEQFILPAPGYVAPNGRQIALPPAVMGVATPLYDDSGTTITITAWPPGPGANGAPPPAGAIRVDYVIAVDGKTADQGSVTPRPGTPADTGGYKRLPSAADPAQVLALSIFTPATGRGGGTTSPAGMGAYSFSASQISRGRRDNDPPDGPTTCARRIPMPSDDRLDTLKVQGQAMVRVKDDRSGYEVLNGVAVPPEILALPVPAKPPGGWCDEDK